MITEDGTKITHPQGTKDYISNYYEQFTKPEKGPTNMKSGQTTLKKL